MPQIKTKYSNPYNDESLETFALVKYFPKNLILNEVNKNPDLIIEYVHKNFSKEFLSSPKSILVSGENLYYPINFFKFNEYISKKSPIKFAIFNKILPKKILNLNLGLMRPKYLRYIKKLSKKPKKGKYAILSNNIKGKNIFVLPTFMQMNYEKKDFQKKKITKIPEKFCCIIISNESAFDRIEFTKKLSKYKQVDIYGRTSLTNSDNSKLPKNFGENSKFYSQYKFVICFENSFEEEYITEKLPNAFLGNSIPIYRGAPNIKNYFNTKSFINYEGSYDEMIKKIIHLDKNDKKYLKVLNTPSLTKENKIFIEKKENELKQFLKKITSN